MAEDLRPYMRFIQERRAIKPSRKRQLPHTSLEQDDAINQYRDDEGNTAQVIGSQFDGGYGVLVTSDPVPPVSSPANAVAGPESIAVQVPGTFVDNAGVTDLSIVAPTYFSRYEIHVSTDPDFTAEFAETLMGTIDSPRGGWVVVSPLPADVQHYVRIVVRSQSGKASEGSAVVEVTPRPKLQPGDLDGKHITGTTFTTRNSRGLWSDDGLFIFREDGSARISLPTDDSPPQIDADLISRSITSLGNASMQGTGNEITSGADLVLSAGVTPPASPPSTTITHEVVSLPPPPESKASVHGLAYRDGLYWRAVNVWDTPGDRLEGIASDGTIITTIPIAGGGPLYGLTAIDDVLYVLLKVPSGKVMVKGYSAITKAFVREWEYPNFGTGTYLPGIGTDGANIIIAQCWANGDTTWRTFLIDGTFGQQTDADYPLSSDIVAIHQGAADYGAQRVTITKANGTSEQFHTYGSHIPFSGWYSSQREDVVGMCWDGSAFRTLSDSGRLVTYTSNWDLEPDNWWVVNTWADASGYETTVGPAKRFTLPNRSFLHVTTPPIPSGASESRIYLAQSASEPAAADYGLLAVTTEPTAVVDTFTMTTPPPTTNTFPDSSPALLWSKRGNFRVDGTGAGAWGPLTFHADGTMTGDEPDWIPITTWNPGFGPHTFGFTPAYRVWPSGKVEWKGTIGRVAGSGDQPFTVPAEARTLEPVNKVAAANVEVNGMSRVEFCSLGAPTMASIFPMTGVVSWICLDGIYYYLEGP